MLPAITDIRHVVNYFPSIQWRKKWQPTPVFLPGKFQGQRSLVGYTVHGVTETDTTGHLPSEHL